MKILVFAPNSEIWVHAFPEALIVEALQQEGHQIIYVTCGRAYADFCVPIDMYGLSARSGPTERAAICKSCSENAAILRDTFGFPGFALAEQMTAEDRASAEKYLSALTAENFIDFRLDGVPVGRYALYEFVIRNKLQELRFDDQLWTQFRFDLRHAIFTQLVCIRILERERPDRLLVYNGLYSVNHIACAVAELKGVASYFLHAGGNIAHRLQKLMLCRDQNVRYFEDAIERWPAFRDRPCPPALMAEITDHFIELLSGRSGFVYSPRGGMGTAGIRAKLGIPQGSRVLAAAMSSPDEMLAAQLVHAKTIPGDLMFPSQIEWIKALITYIETRPDLFLVVRVHPREFPNRREGLKSEHARLLEQTLDRLPPNVRVNWPDQNVSLYELAELTDVFLSAHSAVGKEMTLLGRPVVLYGPSQVLYTPDINYVARTREEYFAQIERALAEGWNARHIRDAYRWLAVEYGYGLIDISDSYKKRETARPGIPQRAVNRALRFVDPKHSEKRDCRQRAARLASRELINSIIVGGKTSVLEAGDPARLGTATEAEETAALRREVRRIMDVLYGGDATPQAGSLHASLHRFAHESAP